MVKLRRNVKIDLLRPFDYEYTGQQKMELPKTRYIPRTKLKPRKVVRFVLFLFLLINLGLGCNSSIDTRQTLNDSIMKKDIMLTTSDGLKIAANVYIPSKQQDKYALLLHMMPATKESWEEFAVKLAELGYTSIAIDERGHGQSTQGGKLDYKTMDDSQQQAKILDARAAFDYLKTIGATEENTVIIGASIGANLAIQMISETPKMQKAVALSPGIDYGGVTTDDKIQSLSEGQSVLLIASEEDKGSFESIEKLNLLNPEQTVLIKQTGLGHGTSMFEAKPELMDLVIEWLK